MSKELGARPKLQDVADQASVSIGTASRALNNHPDVDANVRLRVLHVASEIGYLHRGRHAKKKIVNATTVASPPANRIAFCCRSVLASTGADNPYFSQVLQGVENECNRQNVHVVYSIAEDTATELQYATQRLRDSGVEGMILVNFTDHNLVKGLLDLNLATILVDHAFPDLPLDTITNDSYQGTVQAMRYLMDCGHRRIAFIDGLAHYPIEMRRAGYRMALDAAGINFNPAWILPGALDIETGSKAADEFVRRGLDCTAVMCSNDSLAIGFIQGLARHNLRVPDDISVVGFDDIEMARLVSPALTTVRANMHALGRAAVRRVLERLTDPTVPPIQIVVHGELIERASVRSIRDTVALLPTIGTVNS